MSCCTLLTHHTHPPTSKEKQISPHPPTHMKPTVAHSNHLLFLYLPINSLTHPLTHPPSG